MKMIPAFAAIVVIAMSLTGCKYEADSEWPVMDLAELRASGDAWPDTRKETFAAMDGFDERLVRQMSWRYAEFNTLTAFQEDWEGLLDTMTKPELTSLLFCLCYCLSYNEGCRLNGIDKEAHVAMGNVTLFGSDAHPRLARLGVDPLPYIIYEDAAGDREFELPRRHLLAIANAFGKAVKD